MQHFKPSWWSDQDDSTWARVKAAIKRDWEQTKQDLKPGGVDYDQDVADTIKQAVGKAPIPPLGVPTPPSKRELKKHAKAMGWDEAEDAISYGYAARAHYGATFSVWDEKLERELREEWNKGHKNKPWEEVRQHVRTGFDSRL